MKSFYYRRISAMILYGVGCLIVLLSSRVVDGLSVASSSTVEGRRPFLISFARSSVFVGGVLLAAPPATVQAAESATTTTTRQDLLQAIADQKSELEVLQIIEQLPRSTTTTVNSNNKAAALADLDGTWKLLWSAKAEAFSPLLKLPKPFQPDSYQYWGPPAAAEVGPGRLAQGLTGGILSPNRQLWLSSGITTEEALPDAASTANIIVKIVPPFRLELGGPAGSHQVKQTLVQAGSDAAFRQTNARTVAAQQAGANLYEQVYVERKGVGSLRVSKIIAGDPVIVGAVFVHQKL